MNVRPRKFWRRAGFTFAEMMVVVGIVSQIPQGSFGRAKQKALEVKCVSNLRSIGMNIIAHGEFPDAAFYPKDPKNGKDSIRKIIGGGEKPWICPSLPDALQKRGLTYVYNDELAGQSNPRNAEKKWVLIEMSCVSHSAPHPHPAGYNVLFADGHVITTKRLPRKIQEAWHQE